MANEEAQNTSEIPDNDQDFLSAARTWYKQDYEADRENIENAGDDIRFYANDQWLNEDRVAREAQNRPVITEDHLAPAVRQITNDMRMNKPALKVRGIDSNADPEIASIFEGNRQRLCEGRRERDHLRARRLPHHHRICQ